jgi:hypothetical protein
LPDTAFEIRYPLIDGWQGLVQTKPKPPKIFRFR